MICAGVKGFGDLFSLAVASLPGKRLDQKGACIIVVGHFLQQVPGQPLDLLPVVVARLAVAAVHIGEAAESLKTTERRGERL